MSGIELVAAKIGVSINVPGTTQQFNLTENIAKLQINDSFVPIANGATSKIIWENRNNSLSGFRWTQETANGDTCGTYKLFKFVADDPTGVEILGFDQSGNATFANSVTIVGGINIPSNVNVEGNTQSFSYSGDHLASFQLKNQFAAAIGVPSVVELDFINSTGGGYKLLHTSSTTDTAGLGSFKLQAMNNVGVTLDIAVGSVDSGSGVAVFHLPGNGFFDGINNFNQGGVGTSTFNGQATFNGETFVPTPTLSGQATNKTYVDTAILANVITLTGAVTGSAAGTIPTTLASSIAVSGATQGFVVSGNSTATFQVQNAVAATLGSPVHVDWNLLNSTGNGFRFHYTSDAGSDVGTLKLQLVDTILSTVSDAFTVSASTTSLVTFNGAAAFAGPVTFTGTPVSAIVNLSYYPFTLYNSNAGAVTEYVISGGGSPTPVLKVGYNTSGAFGYIDTLGNPFVITYGGNATAIHKIQNTLAATSGHDTFTRFDILNSTGGGYQLLNTSDIADTNGIGVFTFRSVDNSGVNATIFRTQVTGGGLPELVVETNTSFSGTIVVPTPTLSGQAATKAYVDSTVSGSSITLTGAVTGSGAGTIATTLTAITTLQISNFNSAVLGYRLDQFSIPIGSLNLSSQKIINLGTPSSSSDGATKGYVDSTVSGSVITLTGAVTGSAAGTIATTLASSIAVSGASQGFVVSGNATATHQIQNARAATGGSPSLMRLDIINSTTGGYRFLHTSSSTDTAGLGTLKLQALNNSAVTVDAVTVTVSGGGVPDVAFNGSATFNGAVTFGGTPVTAVVNLASYPFTINNTNASAVTEYVISNTTPVIKLGYNTTSALGYVDALGSPFSISSSGTSRLYIDTSGNVGLGTTAPHAPLQFSSSLANRIIVLYEAANNDHQYYGFGVNAGLVRYQLGNTSSSHVFYAATSSSASTELLRITGTGLLGVGMTPTYPVDVNGAARAAKLLGNSSTPSFSIGTAPGTASAALITGSELSGTFSFTAGTGATSGSIATFTLANNMSSSTYGVIFTAAVSSTATINVYAISTSTSQFTLSCTSALASGTSYKWNYHIIGN